jgi:hypothetical protein
MVGTIRDPCLSYLDVLEKPSPLTSTVILAGVREVSGSGLGLDVGRGLDVCVIIVKDVVRVGEVALRFTSSPSLGSEQTLHQNLVRKGSRERCTEGGKWPCIRRVSHGFLMMRMLIFRV